MPRRRSKRTDNRFHPYPMTQRKQTDKRRQKHEPEYLFDNWMYLDNWMFFDNWMFWNFYCPHSPLRSLFFILNALGPARLYSKPSLDSYDQKEKASWYDYAPISERIRLTFVLLVQWQEAKKSFPALNVSPSPRSLQSAVCEKSEKPAIEPTPETVENSLGGDTNGGKCLVPTSKAPRF
ncbi:hypothetical protein C8R42DRAFT_731428 [Lentinula raphanica]|nr:hypothetical protein C8R42DRAFT_731428 [Lentinula raphanica]